MNFKKIIIDFFNDWKFKGRLKLFRKIFSLILFLLLFCLFLLYIIKPKKIKVSPNSVVHKLNQIQNKSIFNIKELNSKEFAGKIILLNIYNVNNFSYIFSIDLADKIDHTYGNKLAVIDIISNNFISNPNNIIDYIIKNSIERPVINVPEIYSMYNLDNTKNYFILVDRDSIIYKQYDYNETDDATIITDVDKLVSSSKQSNNSEIVKDLENKKKPETFIKSLSHIEYVDKIPDTNNIPYLIISDSKGNKIYITTINGKIVNQFGNNYKGFKDGIGSTSNFCYPSGMTIKDNRFLFVSDTCNDAIRKIDLKTLQVSTLLKNIKKPTDVKTIGDDLIILSKNEILYSYNIEDKSIQKIDCDVCKGSINQLVKYNNKVYFINDGYLNYIDINKKITKDINLKNLNQELDFNNNFNIDETGIYFVDRFKNKISHLKDNKIKTYISNLNKPIFDMPTNIIDIKDKIYVTNENKKELISIDKYSKSTNSIQLSFGYEYNKVKNTEEEFLDVNSFDEIQVSSGNENIIKINLDSLYSFEKKAPIFLNLFKEDLKNNSAILIKEWNKNDILSSNTLKLPNLSDNSVYYLKGDFYYYNVNSRTPYLINKYRKKLKVSSDSDFKEINIDFLYEN